MLAACLDAVASLRVRPAGAWEGALWGALDTRASRLSLTVGIGPATQDSLACRFSGLPCKAF
eukprot:1143455-Pelagomonas_calceolata.AAC.2